MTLSARNSTAGEIWTPNSLAAPEVEIELRSLLDRKFLRVCAPEYLVDEYGRAAPELQAIRAIICEAAAFGNRAVSAHHGKRRLAASEPIRAACA